jgi:hypothetical protein
MPDDQKDISRKTHAVGYDPVLFHNNEQIYVIYKKIEAIAGAIFLITHGIANTEAIKQTLREQSLSSLSHIVSLLSKPAIEIIEFQGISSNIIHLHSLLDIAFWSGTVSQMNASLVQKEISQVYKMSNDLTARYKGNFYLDSNFFSKTNQETTQVPVNEKVADAPKPDAGDNKGHYKGQNIKDKKTAAPLAQKGDRRELILAFLARKDNVSIKDVASEFPQYSEKTIQRELLSLVDQKMILKQGERRWSTYSVAR